MRKGNAGEASGLPFVAGAVNCAIWLKYALLIDDSAMKLVNGIGVLILCTSSAIFYKYTPNKASALKQIVFAIGFFGTISFYVNSVSTYTFLNYILIGNIYYVVKKWLSLRMYFQYCPILILK